MTVSEFDTHAIVKHKGISLLIDDVDGDIAIYKMNSDEENILIEDDYVYEDLDEGIERAKEMIHEGIDIFA